MAVVEHGQRAAGWRKNSFDSHCGHPFEIDGQRLDHFGAHARSRATRNGGAALRKYFRQG
jgi:hypothetical protein